MTAISKSEFAIKYGIRPNTLSTWLKRGHLAGAALLADGRLDLEEAERQLAARLDQSRSLGKRAAAELHAKPEIPSEVGGLAAIKLEQAQRALQRDREADLERRGVYVRAEDIRREHSRELAQFIAIVEQRLPELVAELGGGKDAIVRARRWWRSLRAAESTRSAERVAELPEFLPPVQSEGLMPLHAA